MPKFPQNDGVRSANINNCPKYKKAEHNAQATPQQYEDKNINLGNSPTNFLGRSQVQKAQRLNLKNFDAQMVENIKKDMLAFSANKNAHVAADAVFEKSYNKESKENNPNAYEHAVKVQSEFINEFQK
ncbi:MAG: hypothetical protein WCK67_11635 [bacterium]